MRWPRSAQSEHRQGDRSGLADRRSSANEESLNVERMFPSLLEVTIGRELPIECSKLTCSAKVKNRHGTQAVRSTIEVGCCQSSCVDCEAEFDLGRGKIGRRRRIHTENTKTTTIIDTRIRIHTSSSRSEVDVRWPATDRRCMRLDPVYVALPTSLS